MSSKERVKKSKNKKAVLEALVDAGGAFISGSRISSTLGISRAAVWKHIDDLRDDGYNIDSSPRIGHRLVSYPDRLYPLEIKRSLRTDFLGQEIEYQTSLRSSNDEAFRLASGGAPEGTVIIAEEQTGGKGRMGRTWISPRYQGIWFSIILRPTVPPADAGLVTLAAATAVARAIGKETGLNAQIKWPNDILLNEKKVAGILLEMSSEQDMINFIVVGIGINANLDITDLPQEIQLTAASIKGLTGRKIDRVKLLCAVLQETEKMYRAFNEARPEKIISAWKEKSATLGQKVQVKIGDKTIIGMAEDIDEQGRLIIRSFDGQSVSLSAGEVTILK